MELILWRHAEAEDGFPDLRRALTDKGRAQAKKMAGWLKPRLPKDTRILVSPAVRTQQTAALLTTDFITVDDIAPGASAQAVLAAAGWPDAEGTVVIVGHQPTLGKVASRILLGSEQGLSLKKGAILWLADRKHNEGKEVVLKAALIPSLA
ncbi:MAG: histidine phosphatase family protein [Methylophilaceae bacterium]|nr:histidine phosphatase family protein [Methylophilaceae bacterium]